MLFSTNAFPAHLLSISVNNDVEEKEMNARFHLILANDGCERSMTRGFKLDFLKLINEAIQAPDEIVSQVPHT